MNTVGHEHIGLWTHQALTHWVMETAGHGLIIRLWSQWHGPFFTHVLIQDSRLTLTCGCTRDEHDCYFDFTDFTGINLLHFSSERKEFCLPSIKKARVPFASETIIVNTQDNVANVLVKPLF